MDNVKVRESLAATISTLDKVAYLPPGEEQPGGMPMTPEAMAAPPMDPMAAAGGMPPVDPMTGMPMDPAMMGGGMPMPPVDPMTGMPMDPAMMGGTPMSDPAAMGADPMAALAGLLPGGEGGEDPAAASVTIPVDDFRQLIDTVVRMSKEMTSIAGKAADAGSPSPDADRLASLEEAVSNISNALGLESPAPEAAPAPEASKVASENITKLSEVLSKLK